MPIDSTSSIDDVIAQYVDNANYETLAAAKLFRHACRVLLLKMPAQVSQDRGGLSLSPALVAAELKKVEQYIGATPDTTASSTGAGGVRHFDLSNFRGDT